MVRTITSALALLTVTVLIAAGCSDEDYSDLKENWKTEESDLVTRLAAVQNSAGDLQTTLSTEPAAMNPDSAVAAKRQVIEQSLENFQSQFADVQQTIDKYKAKRDEADKTGSRAEFETAWNEAKIAYDGAMTKLNTIQTELGTMKERVSALGSPVDQSTSGTDTGVATSGEAIADTTSR